MAAYETAGENDEWYTPFYIFEALGCRFDLDVASPAGIKTCVPADRFLTATGLSQPWQGFVWMNPPFGHQRTKRQWLSRFFDHGNGLALTPDRTSAPWFREAWWRADAVMFIPKVKFYRLDNEKNDGSFKRGDSPGTGSTIWASGGKAVAAMHRAAERGLGIMALPHRVRPAVGEVLKQAATGSLEEDIRQLQTWDEADRRAA